MKYVRNPIYDTIYNKTDKSYTIKGEIETLCEAKKLIEDLTINYISRYNVNLIVDFISDKNITYDINTITTLVPYEQVNCLYLNNEYILKITLNESKDKWILYINTLNFIEIKK